MNEAKLKDAEAMETEMMAMDAEETETMEMEEVEMADENGNTEEAGILQGEVVASEEVETTLMHLEKMENTIRQGLTIFRTVGELLWEINEKKLYKLRNYESFMDYCREQLGLSKSHSYHLIAHASICHELGVAPSEVKEKVVRPLSRIKDVAERKVVWLEAVARSGKEGPSSKVVSELVHNRLEAKKLESQACADVLSVSEETLPATDAPISDAPEVQMKNREQKAPAPQGSVNPPQKTDSPKLLDLVDENCFDFPHDSGLPPSHHLIMNDLAAELIKKILSG